MQKHPLQRGAFLCVYNFRNKTHSVPRQDSMAKVVVRVPPSKRIQYLGIRE